jgi:GTPase SAR1 family protein
MQIELTDRLRKQADIILGLYDFTAEKDEEIIEEWVRLVRDLPDHLYAGASLGYMEVYLTRVLVDMIDSNEQRG